MHHIYHTEAFVLESRNVGEADKVITLYTRELGLIRASAKGIRLLKSKLRFSLQDFSYANVDLVRGKEFWKVTSASTISSFPFLRRNLKSLNIIARVSKLLCRLSIGEGANDKIFNDLITSFNRLDNENFENEMLEAIELYLVLSIVHELGYLGELDLIEDYLSKGFNESKVSEMISDRSLIISHINKAIRESQL
jgi:DNA repair protein RecO (recombination protein O)